MSFYLLLIGIILIQIDLSTPTANPADPPVPIPLDQSEASALKFVQELEPQINTKCYSSSIANWNYVTNLTPANQARSTATGLEYSEFRKIYYKSFVSFPWKNFKDRTLKRQFFLESVLSTDILPPDKIKLITDLINNMTEIYSTAKICKVKRKEEDKPCELISLDPELTQTFAQSRNYDDLAYLWTEWRKESGGKMPLIYSQHVELLNEAAVLNGYHDMGEIWRRPYEDQLIHLEMWALWGQLRPMYEQLHAFARKRLKDFYQREEITKNGSIPAHIFGNMWAQNWANIYADILIPYKEKASSGNPDVTNKMIQLNYTVLQMFQDSDKFFTSLGLLPMTPNFWNNSILLRPPPPREIVCHPEAFDLCNSKDFFIKMCSTVSMRDYITAHHEMGHIQYYMQYKDQLATFREGANPGFHEAIGDTISLSVSSPKHLKEIGLLDSNYKEGSKENRINFLLSQALKVFVDIPWALTLEQWRWDVFSGKIQPSQYNCHWWALRSQIQGVKPPLRRSSKDFDPGAKFHVPNSMPYDRYFFARILTFQFQEALCKLANQFEDKPKDNDKPNKGYLHECSIYKSKEAGSKLASMLKLGSSKPWPEALEMVTGSRKLNAKSLLNYYAPLMEWLEEENSKTGETIGWIDDQDEEQFCS